jgi:hypothetical protein
MKKIEYYYWVAKDENAARVIVALLGVKYSLKRAGYRPLNKECSFLGYGPKFYVRADKSVDGCMNSTGRTKATIEQLVEWALKGFDMREPWEIPPEGYRLVTDEEREKFGKPSDVTRCQYRGIRETWDGCLSGDIFWYSDYAYAVPEDYEFKPVVEEMTVEQICKELGREVKIVK